MDDIGPRWIIRQTLLSRKPRPSARLVTFLGLDVLLIASLVYWHDGYWLAQPAIPERVFQHHEYWRLFSAIAVHTDVQHLFSNSLLFGVLSYLLYGYFGFWVFPLMSLVFGALTNYLSLLTYPPYTQLLGASGVVYWMAGCWVTLYLFIDRQLSFRKRGLRSLGFCLCLLVPSTIEPHVSYRTHAIGFVLGVVYGLIHFYVTRRKLRQAEVVEPEFDYDIEAVDQSWPLH